MAERQFIGSRGRGATSHGWSPQWFLLPFAIPFLGIYLLPVLYATGQSLTKVERTGGIFTPPVSVFAGLAQYQRALGDPDFMAGVWRVVLFSVVQIPVMLGLALALALLLDTTVARFRRVHRLVMFAPYGIPGVVAALMWAFLYDPRLSPLTDVLSRIGIRPDFLGGDAVLWSIANVVTWTYTGYNMLILYAALQAIPSDLLEAARVDGASGLRVATAIKIPLIAPALVLAAVFSIIGGLQLFTEPQVLHTISTSITSSFTPSMAAYSAASANDYAYAAALSLLVALVSFVLSFGFLRVTSRWSGV